MKDNEKLLYAIGEADENHIPDMIENASDKPMKTISRVRKIAIASGACAAVIVGAIAINSLINNDVPITADPSSSYIDEAFIQLLEEHRIYPQISDMKAEHTELESIASDIVFGGMGFEGYMVNDISELDTINPWSADKPLESLPVYKNLSIKENCDVAVYLTQEQMEEMAKDAAYCLGVEVTSTSVEVFSDITYNPPEEVADLPYCVEAVCSGEAIGVRTVEIRVFGDGEMSISLMAANIEEGMRLPDKYSFTYSDTTDEQAIAVMEYLSDEFKGLLQLENPAVYSCGDRNIYGERTRDYYVYDKREDYKQDILSYNFTNTEFCPDDNGNLMIIHINNPLSAAQNLGEYPIIDAQEATQLLLSGSYITTVPTEYLSNGEITAEAIAKTELIYRIGEQDEYYQPYYKFYVALSDENYAADSRPEGMKEYGGFYVPAVEGKYLSDISVWDGSFN